MIRINLLDSVTERQAGTAVLVERKIASPASRLMMMSLAAFLLLTTMMGFDYITAERAKAQAESDLQVQKQKETELAAILKEQKELEAKILNIETRIAAIQKLRDSQAGPSAVLDAMRERIAMVPGVYLASVEQTGEQLTIKGDSPDESAVTQFGRSLEFSGGLFSNLNIETQRKEKPNQPAPVVSANADAPPRQEIVGFTIRCAYTPSKANTSQNTMATTASNGMAQPAKPAGTVTLQESVKQQLPKPGTQTDGSTIPPQVAKN